LQRIEIACGVPVRSNETGGGFIPCTVLSAESRKSARGLRDGPHISRPPPPSSWRFPGQARLALRAGHGVSAPLAWTAPPSLPPSPLFSPIARRPAARLVTPAPLPLALPPAERIDDPAATGAAPPRHPAGRLCIASRNETRRTLAALAVTAHQSRRATRLAASC